MRVKPMTFQVSVECPTGICKVMGSTATGDSENSFSKYSDLRALLHYLHIIMIFCAILGKVGSR